MFNELFLRLVRLFVDRLVSLDSGACYEYMMKTCGPLQPSRMTSEILDEQSRLAPREGLEPSTCRLGGGRAIQLCHRGSVSSRLCKAQATNRPNRQISDPSDSRFQLGRAISFVTTAWDRSRLASSRVAYSHLHTRWKRDDGFGHDFKHVSSVWSLVLSNDLSCNVGNRYQSDFIIFVVGDPQLVH